MENSVGLGSYWLSGGKDSGFQIPDSKLRMTRFAGVLAAKEEILHMPEGLVGSPDGSEES